ncbi:MAG: ligand-binding protein SH3 [Sedimentisphaerales bacterium]|nr:ligand-binding protein SH3 [Sedimentisphaerales bacterium]
MATAFEIAWPGGFRLSQTTPRKWLFIALGVLSMALSSLFLWPAQRDIRIGTAYAVWTGIGAAGMFLTGVAFFADLVSLLRILPFLLVLSGFVGLRLTRGRTSCDARKRVHTNSHTKILLFGHSYGTLYP